MNTSVKNTVWLLISASVSNQNCIHFLCSHHIQVIFTRSFLLSIRENTS